MNELKRGWPFVKKILGALRRGVTVLLFFFQQHSSYVCSDIYYIFTEQQVNLPMILPELKSSEALLVPNEKGSWSTTCDSEIQLSTKSGDTTGMLCLMAVRPL